MENKPEENADSNSSLEQQDTQAETQEHDVNALSSDAAAEKPEKPTTSTKRPKGHRIRELISRLNIYLLLFIFILLLTGMIIFIGVRRNQQVLNEPAINIAELNPETIEELSGSEATVGDPKQTLNIESNSVFAGKVLIRDSLDVAGTIRVGGDLSLPGITVSGTSNFDQIQANNLSIAGDTNIQGALTVQQNLTVSGGATFGGPISAPQITVESFQVTGDLTITRHIDAGGGTPGLSNGSALGSGGTASVSGSDTAGTVTINTGGGPGAGCFATINFTQPFTGTPHVVVTPVGSAAGAINFYVNRTTTSFSVCTSSPPPAGSNFSFDYIAID